MKKRWLSAALCTAMVAGSLAGCGLKSPETTTTAAATEAAKEEATTAAEAKEESKGESAAAGEPVGPAVTLVMAEVNPLDTIVGQTDTAFKEKVEELSGGSRQVVFLVLRTTFWIPCLVVAELLICPVSPHSL